MSDLETIAATAKCIVDAALDEMARTSGASRDEIYDAILSNPTGNAAVRFRQYVTLGVSKVGA